MDEHLTGGGLARWSASGGLPIRTDEVQAQQPNVFNCRIADDALIELFEPIAAHAAGLGNRVPRLGLHALPQASARVFKEGAELVGGAGCRFHAPNLVTFYLAVK